MPSGTPFLTWGRASAVWSVCDLADLEAHLPHLTASPHMALWCWDYTWPPTMHWSCAVHSLHAGFDATWATDPSRKALALPFGSEASGALHARPTACSSRMQQAEPPRDCIPADEQWQPAPLDLAGAQRKRLQTNTEASESRRARHPDLSVGDPVILKDRHPGLKFRTPKEPDWMVEKVKGTMITARRTDDVSPITSHGSAGWCQQQVALTPGPDWRMTGEVKIHSWSAVRTLDQSRRVATHMKLNDPVDMN
ncbi:hypothetical protein NDU88_004886 [Pleurodeles waltl]|uniref:Uncharacterized protein n=1 Tax=Pleurodeles waltl TaxID=8319 RepID=A0AAV7LAJ8_PLEWA|nr:hypothetical protein NDU88_004886 [Pleurodeles waltl]